MTSTQRAVIAAMTLAFAGTFAIVAMLVGDGSAASIGAAVGAAGSTFGLVLGYVFGNANGERRLASAIVQNAAARGGDSAVDDLAAGLTPHNGVAIDSEPPA